MANVVFSKKIKQLSFFLSFFFLLLSSFARADFTVAMANYEAKKFPEAMEEFKRLASLGHKDSQMNLGVMYFRGEGLAKDLIEAYAWMALAIFRW
jgi:TPR repeat protein